MAAKVPLDSKQIAAFCRRHHIQKLSLFGSVLRDDFGPKSGVEAILPPWHPDS